ncbi:MAG: double-strand break repair protein AddB [Hyphomicrobiaceae bacterium]
MPIHEASADSLAEGAGAAANVFTVPPGRPFLKAVAAALLAGDLPSPGGSKPALIDLPAYTILLPTRRAARALQEAFLAAAGGRAMLLPQIRPIAEGDEDASLIATLARDGTADDLDIPPAVEKLERQLVMTRLVMAWSAAIKRAEGDEGFATVASAGAGTPAQAANLARELATLIDAVETENVPLTSLEGLVPEHLSAHWQQTLDFLKVITEAWPGYLASRGFLSPMDRRNRLILAEARRLQETPPKAPIIIAGVTGSIPATAELMRAVVGHAHGAIVLPALDLGLDATTFDKIGTEHPEHPQFGFHKLLDRLGVVREAVRELPGQALAGRRIGRNRLLSEAMRPAGTLDGWRELGAQMPPAAALAALDGVSLIEAATAEDEAETVALILRQAAETPGRTAALVSPDRLLARRVAIRLEAFGIRVDDSAGRPFAKTIPGAFLDLVANAAAHRMAPAELMALLKHPLTRLGLTAGAVRRAARAMELVAFRAPYLGSGLAGLEAAVERAARNIEGGERRHKAVRRLDQRDWDAIRDLVRRIAAAFQPMLDLAGRPRDATMALSELCTAHVEVAEALARPQTAEDGEPSPLWYGEAGEAAARLMGELMAEASPAPPIAFGDYPDFYRSLIAGESVRSRVPVHPRLSIWGPLEARMQQTDVVVLGSLNEGTWPAAADPGAWLNRPMRATLGLPAPEEETGRSAHDLVSLAGADRVILTRAAKVDGVPSVPSRWLLRLKALLDGLGVADGLVPAEPWLAWARNRDRIVDRQTIRAPEPRPPLAMRPRRMSLSDVETWMANPYAIYARHVLGLEALPRLGVRPGPSEKGQILHEALSRFAKQHPDRLPGDIAAVFLAMAVDVASDLGAEPRVRAFWLPRFKRFAEWFAENEPDLRQGTITLLAEVDGAEMLAAPGGPFALRGRADRMDVTAQGVIITDYKTGTPPSDSAVKAGLAPQLPLEAALVAAGAFAGIPASPVAGLRYIRASGGEPPGVARTVDFKDGSVAKLAADVRAGLLQLIAAFDDPATPYKAVRRRRFNYAYDDYAGLARVGEWSLNEDGGENEGGEGAA